MTKNKWQQVMQRFTSGNEWTVEVKHFDARLAGLCVCEIDGDTGSIFYFKDDVDLLVDRLDMEESVTKAVVDFANDGFPVTWEMVNSGDVNVEDNKLLVTVDNTVITLQAFEVKENVICLE